MAKRILVTGGAGFIPSNFIHHLLAKTPYEVVSLDALTYAGNLDNLSGAMSHERLSFVQGDIRDAELVRDIVAQVDVIVNAAAESHVEKSIEEGAREFVTERPGQVDRHIGSTDKMQRLTGWQARTSFDEGLVRTIAWYRDNEAWWRGLLESETGASVSSS